MSVTARPATVECVPRLSEGVDEASRASLRHARALEAPARRKAYRDGLAATLGGSAAARVSLDQAFAALIPDAQERALGPVLPRAGRRK